MRTPGKRECLKSTGSSNLPLSASLIYPNKIKVFEWCVALKSRSHRVVAHAANTQPLVLLANTVPLPPEKAPLLGHEAPVLSAEFH